MQVTLQSNYYAIISCYYVLEIEGQLLEFSGPNYDGTSIFVTGPGKTGLIYT